MDALERLKPVKFNYKRDKEEEHVGFIAEEVPDLVATKGRKAMNAMDVVALLTKVVQEQQKTISDFQKTLVEQQKTLSALRKKVGELEKRVESER